MKIFVFQNVLSDYTSGMALIAAESYDEAIEYAREEFDYNMEELGWESPAAVYECVGVEAGVLEHMWGGG